MGNRFSNSKRCCAHHRSKHPGTYIWMGLPSKGSVTPLVYLLRTFRKTQRTHRACRIPLLFRMKLLCMTASPCSTHFQHAQIRRLQSLTQRNPRMMASRLIVRLWRRRMMLRARSQVYTTCKGTRQHRTIHGRFLVSLFSWF